MTQKAVASSDGSAIVAVALMAAGKQVFLGAIITPPTVMQSMTSEDTTNKKRPTAVKKVRLAPVQKQLPRKFPSTRADNMETTINTRQVMGMVGVGIGMVGRVRRDGWDVHWDDWDGHGNGWDGHGDGWDGSPCRNGPTQQQLCRSCRRVRTIPPLGHMYPLKPLQPTPRSALSSPRLLLPTPTPALSSPHLLQPTPTPAPSSPHLLQPTPRSALSSPCLLQHTPTPASSSPCLLQPTPTPAPSSPRLPLHTTPLAPSSPRLHHTAWGNWTALFLQKWG